jgi:hypothetical protein
MSTPPVEILLAVLVITFVCTRIMRPKLGHLLALLLSILAWYAWQSAAQDSQTQYLHDMERKYNEIGAPANMHSDARLVQFFHWLQDWRRLNPDAYDNALAASDGILRLERDVLIGVQRYDDNYDVALSLYGVAMNHVHSFLFSIEHPVEVKRLRNALVALRTLLLSHLSLISRTCSTRDTMDAGARYLTDVDEPAPFRGEDPFLVY